MGTCCDSAKPPQTASSASSPPSSTGTINEQEFISTKASECWTTDPNARVIRVEASPDRTLLLPFDQFLYSELTATDTGQHLRLIFASHEISVTGTGLRGIRSALQRMELAGISKTVGRQTPASSIAETSLREIMATEARSSDSTTQNGA